MTVYTDPGQYPPTPDSVVTIGAYDGVHLGHRVILDRIVALARARSAPSVVLSFHPHPRLVVGPQEGGLELLTTTEEKTQRLAAAGIDRVVLYPFTVAFSETDSDTFIRKVLVEELQARTVVVGYDHRFGRGRGGGLDELRQGGQRYGFEVEEIPPQAIDDAKVSSTRIRQALQGGQLAEANRLLGYRYSLTGTVVPGKQLGRTLGYPTANLVPDDPHKLVPALGIYAVQCTTATGAGYPGLLSIGTNPTVSSGASRTIEAFLIGFSGDLYGQPLTVALVAYLRPEARFDSLEALRAQMDADRAAAEQLFARL